MIWFFFKSANVEENVEDFIEENDDKNYEANSKEYTPAFKCLECDFIGGNKNELRMHISLKHKKIVQLNGDLECESECQFNIWTDKNWRNGYIGDIFQTYLDVVKEINFCDLSQEFKDEEIDNVKKARLKVWVESGMPPERCTF